MRPLKRGCWFQVLYMFHPDPWDFSNGLIMVGEKPPTRKDLRGNEPSYRLAIRCMSRIMRRKRIF